MRRNVTKSGFCIAPVCGASILAADGIVSVEAEDTSRAFCRHVQCHESISGSFFQRSREDERQRKLKEGQDNGASTTCHY
jgi:hypothetical protein